MTYVEKTPLNAKKTPVFDNLEALKGIGPKSVQKFHKLGIYQAIDLLFHLPSRYEDRTRIRTISSLKPGESALIKGTIIQSQVKVGRRRSLLVRITDGSRFFNLRFFYFSVYQEKSFIEDKEIVCFGEIRRGPESLEMVHPEYSFAETDKSLLSDHLTPTYPTTEGLPQKLLRSAVDQVVDQLISDQLSSNKKNLTDLLPKHISQQMELPALEEAIIALHKPNASSDTFALLNFKHPAQKRLIFEELLAHHLSMKQLLQQKQKFN